MKRIAVIQDYGQVASQFNRAEWMKIYEVSNNCVIDQSSVRPNGSGHQSVAATLQTLGVDTLVCGRIDDRSRDALSGAGIRLYSGVGGSADAAVKALLTGKLRDHCSSCEG